MNTLKRLTENQREVFLLLLNFRVQYGRNPSIREMGSILGLAPTPIFERLRALIKKGYIIRDIEDNNAYKPTRDGISQCRYDGEKPYRIKKSYPRRAGVTVDRYRKST